MSNNHIEYNATYDLVFKQMMKNPKVAKSITEALLGIDIDINEIFYVETELNEGVEFKSSRFDVRFQISKKLEFDYEMQKRLPSNVSLEAFRKRMEYYHSLLIATSLKKGESYNDMKTCIQVVFCNFPINYKDAVEEMSLYCNGHRHGNNKTLYIDLTKMDNCDNISFKKWMDIMVTNDFNEESQYDENMLEAINEIKNANKDLAILHALIMQDKFERDQITGLQEATDKGKKEGKEEGIAEGEHNQKILTAKKMLEKQMDIELISEITGLTIEEIKGLF